MVSDSDQFLRALLRGQVEGWPSRAGAEFQEGFVQSCTANGVAPLVHFLRERAGRWDGWPDQVRHRLKSEETGALLLQELMDRELAAVLGRLHSHGVHCLLLKGAALARLAYPAPHTRPRLDSDLWVRLNDWQIVEDCLTQSGYDPGPATRARVIQSQLTFVRPGGPDWQHNLDVHWKISNLQLFGDSLCFETCWEERQPVPGLGPAAWTLAPAAGLLLACLHRVAHHGRSSRLIWLRDIYELARRLSPQQQEEFLELTGRKQLRAVCRDGLAHALEAFPAIDGVSRLRSWSEEPTTESEESARFLQEAHVRKAVFLSDWRNLEGLRPRLTYLKEHLFPNPTQMLARHPGKGRLWLPLLYLWRILAGSWRVFFPRRQEGRVQRQPGPERGESS